MAFQQSIAVRDAKANSYETTIGTTPVMKFFTGAQPANCAAANSGTEVATGTLPSDWLAAASSGSKTLLGTWTITGIAAAGAGTNIGHYRLYASNGTTCHEQGAVTASGGSTSRSSGSSTTA